MMRFNSPSGGSNAKTAQTRTPWVFLKRAKQIAQTNNVRPGYLRVLVFWKNKIVFVGGGEFKRVCGRSLA